MLPELNVDTVNKIMNEFLENKNKLGKLHNDLENNYGKEYFLTKLSNTLIEAYNSFEKFYFMMDDQELYATKLAKSSKAAIVFFELEMSHLDKKMGLFKRRRILRANYAQNQNNLNALLDSLDEINSMIDKTVKK